MYFTGSMRQYGVGEIPWFCRPTILSEKVLAAERRFEGINGLLILKLGLEDIWYLFSVGNVSQRLNSSLG
jgi:hypothetical protein